MIKTFLLSNDNEIQELLQFFYKNRKVEIYENKYIKYNKYKQQ